MFPKVSKLLTNSKVRKPVLKFFRDANEQIYGSKSHDDGIVPTSILKSLSHHDLLGKHPCLEDYSEQNWATV